METKKVNGGWCKASMVLGTIAIVLALLPLLSAWFMMLTFLNYLIAPLGVICGIVAIVKSQNMTKSIIGLVLCVLALCLPWIMADLYVESAADSVSNAMNMLDSFNN